MPETVVCPNCWAWSELRGTNRCKRCNVPLIHPDGRAVTTASPVSGFAAVAAGGPAVAGSDAPTYFTPLPAPPPVFVGTPAYAITPAGPRSPDWVSIARWITVGYGGLLVLGSLAIGLLVRHVTLSFADPNTGALTTQTYDVGAVCAIVALFFAGLTALFVWLTKFTVARVMFLLLTGAAVLRALAQISTEPVAYAIGTVVALLIDVAYGAVLLMSIVAPRRARPR